MSDKPVYQVMWDGNWNDTPPNIYQEHPARIRRILYPASAYEALRKENAELKQKIVDIETSHKFTNEMADGVFQGFDRALSESENMVEALKAENEAQAKRITELESEDEISAAVIEKCSHLLSSIAVTLKGEQKELSRHSHHDLPELVSVLHLENELNKQRIAELETPLTDAQIASGCLSHRHDFGLLTEFQRISIFNTAKSLEECFRKEREYAASKNGDSK